MLPVQHAIACTKSSQFTCHHSASCKLAATGSDMDGTSNVSIATADLAGLPTVLPMRTTRLTLTRRLTQEGLDLRRPPPAPADATACECNDIINFKCAPSQCRREWHRAITPPGASNGCSSVERVERTRTKSKRNGMLDAVTDELIGLLRASVMTC